MTTKSIDFNAPYFNKNSFHSVVFLFLVVYLFFPKIFSTDLVYRLVN